MPVSEKYWQKANSIIKDNGINSLIIYDEASVNKKNIEDSLKKINVVLDLKKCRDLDFYLGSQKLVYKFCIN